MSSRYLNIPRGKLYWDADVDQAFQDVESDINALAEGAALGSTLVREHSLTLAAGGRGRIAKTTAGHTLIGLYEVIADPTAGSVTAANIAAGTAEANLVPTMTGPTSPSGSATSSGDFGITPWSEWRAWMAFNNDASGNSAWSTAYGIPSGWLAYEFAAPQTVTRYAITYANSQATYAPRSFTLEGETDAGWTILDTQSNQTAWGNGETRTFTCTTTGVYKRYRLNITLNTGGLDYVQITELKLLGDPRATPFIDTRPWTSVTNVAVTLAASEDASNYWRYAVEVAGGLGLPSQRRILASGTWTAADPATAPTNWMTEAQLESVLPAQWKTLLEATAGAWLRVLCRPTGTPPDIASLTINGTGGHRLIPAPAGLFLEEDATGWTVSNTGATSRQVLVRRVG